MHCVYYMYEDEEYTLSQLYKKVRKKRGRAIILTSVVVGLGLKIKVTIYKSALFLCGIGTAKKLEIRPLRYLVWMRP